MVNLGKWLVILMSLYTFFVLINHVFKCAHTFYLESLWGNVCVCESVTLHSLKCKGHRESDTQRSTRLWLSFALGVNTLEDAPVCIETMPGLCTQESGFLTISPTGQSQQFWIYTLLYPASQFFQNHPLLSRKVYVSSPVPNEFSICTIEDYWNLCAPFSLFL